MYVPVGERPAHVAEVGRQLRRRWRDRATTASPARAQLGRRGSTRTRTVWPDDDAGYAPDEWDGEDDGDEREWDDEPGFDDEDEHDGADADEHHRAGEQSGWLGDTTHAPLTMRAMLEALAATRNAYPAPARPARRQPSRAAYRPPMAVLYVSPDQHAPTATGGPRCSHALALPINVVLPVLARCQACGATERVTGGSQLTAVMVPADAQAATVVDTAQP